MNQAAVITEAFESTPASALKVGDTIQVWWGTKRATISGFRPHGGGQDDWTVAVFTDGFSMTVTPEMVLRVRREVDA